MPEPITRITVLLASPGDVNRERGAVRRAVEEINRVTGEAEGFHLTVKGWETHTRPAAGRAQQVINDQIGPTDIFLGIMWHRLGTSTGKAASGTVEEYERARLRHTRSRAAHKPSVMFYFRSTLPRRSSGFDPDQYKAVQAFKAKVFKNGLAREYATVPEFERLIREHLTAEARTILRRHGARPKRRTKAKSAPAKPAAPKRRAPQPKPTGTTPTRTRRKPPLSVPRVPKTITDADRQAFAEKALRSIRTRFEKTAAAFNREHAHARITARRDGATAFTVEAVVEGQRRGLARIRVVEGQWGRRPALTYEEADAFLLAPHREPYFQTRMTATVTERDGALGFEHPTSFTHGTDASLPQAADIAEAFWERFTRQL